MSGNNLPRKVFLKSEMFKEDENHLRKKIYFAKITNNNPTSKAREILGITLRKKIMGSVIMKNA